MQFHRHFDLTRTTQSAAISSPICGHQAPTAALAFPQNNYTYVSVPCEFCSPRFSGSLLEDARPKQLTVSIHDVFLYPVSLLVVLFVSWMRLIISGCHSKRLIKCLCLFCDTKRTRRRSRKSQDLEHRSRASAPPPAKTKKHVQLRPSVQCKRLPGKKLVIKLSNMSNGT